MATLDCRYDHVAPAADGGRKKPPPWTAVLFCRRTERSSELGFLGGSDSPL
jgi:hypothetical protein